LWFGSAAAMTAVLLSNNLGLMWVGIEATTLLTAFLICVHVTPLSLEAMWKYLVVCSVGVAFAFVGTLLVAASAQRLGLDASEMLLWTRLRESAALLAPGPMKLAFLFLLVGYGTQAGLAPLHSWLPDAHSQAPAPVSALFSGFMLNTALYCLMRYLPLVEGATGGTGWGGGLLVVFGILSILLAAVFIVFQHDGKRLLAYHSVEHIGIIALGLGLGGIGIFAALWHTLNHAVCKALAFFSVGRLGQMYGTHDLGRMAGAMRRSPVWGIGFFGGVLALIGVAPFAIFMSEFQILRAAAAAHAFVALTLFLLGAGVVFVGALRHAMTSAWGEEVCEPKLQPGGVADAVLVFGALALLLLLGLWMPGPLRTALEQAALIVGGRP
jgi:hydrogenase-4 component F